MVPYKAFAALVFTLSVVPAICQARTQADSVSTQIEKQKPDGRHSFGSSLFLLGNLAPGDPPYFFLMNYGYRLGRKDAIILEAKTWTYYEPLGTYGSSDEMYPGKVRAYGVGIGFQRFYWKRLYSTVQATPFLQQFYDEADKKIQSGFQLYLQLRIGYRFLFFKQRWFIEPAVVFNYWPINTNFPESFKQVEDGAPDYFLFEPGLHFGFRF
jgi:hypothetical protein